VTAIAVLFIELNVFRVNGVAGALPTAASR
jgi:hypothetical protein